MMVKQSGNGYCPGADYHKGWDGRGTSSEASCNAVCMEEPECNINAFMAGTTCNRYKVENCQLSGDTRYVAHKKVSDFN